MDEPSDPNVQQQFEIEQSTVEDSQIGGQAGRDLIQNRGSGSVLSGNTFNIFQSGSAAPLMSPRDIRNRQILLNKICNYWINEALEKFLKQQLQLTIPLRECANAVVNPWAGMAPVEDTTSTANSQKIPVYQLFDQLGDGRTLLILGAPGAGKTIALLKLARHLVNQYEQGTYGLMPVVLNLSFWQSSRQTLADWVQSELHTKYQVPQQVGQSWIESDQLCLLLDGLDEVTDELRPTCVEAINNHHESHAPEMVVCCREQEYADLPNRLNFQAAVSLQPLSLTQIEDHLQSLPDSDRLKRWLEVDENLRELAQSPLMLNLMVQSYQGLDASTFSQTNVLAEQRRQVLSTYVDEMLRRRVRSMRYHESITLCYLQQLAQYLSNISQSDFLIELMQPNWLTARRQKLLYQIAVKAILVMVWGGAHVGLLAGHVEDESFNWVRGAEGALIGIGAGLAYGLIGGFFNHYLTPKIPHSLGRMINALLLGGLYLPIFTWVHEARTEISSAISAGIAYFVIYGLVGLWTHNALYEETIKPAESIRWSQRRIALSLLFGLVIGLALLMGTDNDPLPSILFGLMGGLVLFGFEKQSEVERTSFPNQGIWRSLKNSLRFFFIIGGITGVLLSFLEGPVSGIVNGLILGIGAAIVCGQGSGIVCTKHFVLRFLLWREGKIPWNYRRFLEWGCDLNLLQRVGGGYGFIHRLLLEHLALGRAK